MPVLDIVGIGVTVYVPGTGTVPKKGTQPTNNNATPRSKLS